MEALALDASRWCYLRPGQYPEFMLYVVKNGKTIDSDKIAVGELRHATLIFSADMQTIRIQSGMDCSPSVVKVDNPPPNLRSGVSVWRKSILRTDHW